MVTFILSLILWYRTFIFYAPDQSVFSQGELAVAVFCHPKKRRRYCMIDIQPQNVQFFVDDGRLIYHPPGGGGGGWCPNATHPDLAFILTPHTPICRRSLSFLKHYIYTEMVYKKTFTHLKNPIVILKRLIADKIVPVPTESIAVNFPRGK